MKNFTNLVSKIMVCYEPNNVFILKFQSEILNLKWSSFSWPYSFIKVKEKRQPQLRSNICVISTLISTSHICSFQVHTVD